MKTKQDVIDSLEIKIKEKDKQLKNINIGLLELTNDNTELRKELMKAKELLKESNIFLLELINNPESDFLYNKINSFLNR